MAGLRYLQPSVACRVVLRVAGDEYEKRDTFIIVPLSFDRSSLSNGDGHRQCVGIYIFVESTFF